jgi:hypothetical protein
LALHKRPGSRPFWEADLAGYQSNNGTTYGSHFTVAEPATRPELQRGIMKKLLLFLVVMTLASPALAVYDLPSDRKIDWSVAGVSGGIPSIPDSALQQWTSGSIADCLNTAGKQGCKLPPGTWDLSSALGIPSGKVLRGSGIGKTIIRQTANSDTFAINGNASPPIDRNSPIYIQSGATKGSTQLTFSSLDSSIQAGTFISISEYNADAVGGNIDFGLPYNFAQSGTRRDRGQHNKVVGRSGNTISLAEPIMWTMDSSPCIFKWNTPPKQNAGVEELSIVYTARPSSLRNIIQLQNAANCWVKNVKVSKTSKSSVFLAWTYHVTVQGLWCDDSFEHDNGGEGYGLFMDGPNTYALITNSIFYKQRHSVLIQGAAAGTVVSYNYSRAAHPNSPSPSYIHNDIIHHGAYPMYTLYEGNWAQKLTFDNVHGGSGYSTMFRNYSRVIDEAMNDTWPNDDGSGSYSFNTANCQPVAINIDAYNRYMSLIGNILGWPGWQSWMSGKGLSLSYEGGNSAVYRLGYTGSGGGTYDDLNVEGTLIRHQNYDYKSKSVLAGNAGNGTYETSCQGGSTESVLPNSMYLSGAPGFWCQELPYPPIEPVNAVAGELPAQLRFEGATCTPGGASAPTTLAPPSNLRVVPPVS